MFFQKKFDRGMVTMAYYNLKEYFYKNDQFMNLPNELSEKDREVFYCDFKRVSFDNFVLGKSFFLMKIRDTLQKNLWDF